MRKIETNTIGIDQGDVVLFSDFEDGGDMWTGNGPRLSRKHVSFAESFASEPSVFVSLTMWDVSNAKNMRADVQAEEVTASGFDIVFRTWGDTQVARVRVGWQAIGRMAAEDVWDI